MSLKDRWAKRTEGLVAPSDEPVGQVRAPRTAPGQMLAFRGEILAKDAELAELRAQLEVTESTAPIQEVDPKRIRASHLANRLPHSFQTSEFRRFRDEIEAAGGNVQPIKVRPVAGDTAHDWEIVFGHRRHRACLDLGLKVRAIVADLDDPSLFIEMDRENRGRADLSPYEAGVHYRRALDAELWPSVRQMAEALNVSHTTINQALVLADLPASIVQAFSSPLDLQYRWGKPLTETLQRDPEGILQRAKQAQEARPALSRDRVFALLTEAPANATWSIRIGRKTLAQLQHKGGRVTVQFSKDAVSDVRIRDLERILKEFLSNA